MRQDWEPEDLIEVWTLLEDDMKRVRNKSGATRLGFALLLKFFEVEARFPESAKEVPTAAVEYVAQQVKVPAQAWAGYDWQSKAIQRHRGEIRAAYGFRANTEEDQDRLAAWLATELCPVELSRDRLAAAVVARCRNDHIEPSAPGQVRRLVGKAVKDFEKRFCRSTMDRLSHTTRSRLEDLIAGDGAEHGADGDGAVAGGGRSHFTELKTDPGAPGLESLLAEVNKLERVRRLELPADLFADVSEKLVDAWRARASKEYPANLERMKPPRRLTLLSTLCHVRQTEITDSLVDLFIQLVLKINTRAERKVEKELGAELKKVRGKEAMLLVPGGVHARLAPAPVRLGPRQHAADAAGPRRPEVGRHAHQRGPAGAVPAVLDAREPLWPVRAGHEQPARPHSNGHRARPSDGARLAGVTCALALNPSAPGSVRRGKRYSLRVRADQREGTWSDAGGWPPSPCLRSRPAAGSRCSAGRTPTTTRLGT
ncbi:DUF4158 domain-containing protein [Streptomyces albidoflavus]|uniref:DUF4158 domain-containing protein n=1 Tax=Streptomyces koyangensis TaxID=188770 RepID=UPI003D084093|nr:DUF4158 domain-containing protein [Streptomyces albidoflavus]WTD07134.1 DUF4158 domain-containing protein [Streptomyces albidoflavus]